MVSTVSLSIEDCIGYHRLLSRIGIFRFKTLSFEQFTESDLYRPISIRLKIPKSHLEAVDCCGKIFAVGSLSGNPIVHHIQHTNLDCEPLSQKTDWAVQLKQTHLIEAFTRLHYLVPKCSRNAIEHEFKLSTSVIRTPIFCALFKTKVRLPDEPNY